MLTEIWVSPLVCTNSVESSDSLSNSASFWRRFMIKTYINEKQFVKWAELDEIIIF